MEGCLVRRRGRDAGARKNERGTDVKVRDSEGDEREMDIISKTFTVDGHLWAPQQIICRGCQSLTDAKKAIYPQKNSPRVYNRR